MKSTIKDGKVIFEIDHFSKFAIVSNKSRQNNENSGNTSNNNNTSIDTDNHDATHNDSNSGNSSVAHNYSNIDNTTLGHNDSNNKQTTPAIQSNQPNKVTPLNSSLASSINNSKLGKHLAKTGLANNNLASLAAVGLVLGGALLLGRRKYRK